MGAFLCLSGSHQNASGISGIKRYLLSKRKENMGSLFVDVMEGENIPGEPAILHMTIPLP